MESAPLVGIARLASFGNVLEEKRCVEYRSLPTRRWLNRCHSNRVPFTWTINPYRGCEYGCKYCYARFTHEFLELHDSRAFETEIFAKDWNLASFRSELRQLKPGHSIGIGTATDPYQPSERRFRRTRQVLEALTEVKGIAVYLTTKSDFAGSDADVLAALCRKNIVSVCLTITTVDTELARLLEPFAPRPDLRLNAVSKLASFRVPVGVLASPVLPLITDSRGSLMAVARAAKTSGAGSFSAGVLFLKPSAQAVFFPFLEQRFPGYLSRYKRLFRFGAYLNGSYPDHISHIVTQIREELGLVRREGRIDAVPPGPQLTLF